MTGIIQKIEDGKVYIETDNGQLFVLPIDFVDYVNPQNGDQVFLIHNGNQWKAIRRTGNGKRKSKKIPIAIGALGTVVAVTLLIVMIALHSYTGNSVKKNSISDNSISKSNITFTKQSTEEIENMVSSENTDGESSANMGNIGLIEISKNNPNPVIFQDKNFLVQASTITYSDDIYHFHFSVTNNTDKNVYVDVTQANVDDDNTWISTYSYGTYDNVGVKNTTTQVDAGGINPSDLEKLGLADYKVLKLEVTIQDIDDNEISVVNISVPRTMLPSI